MSDHDIAMTINGRRHSGTVESRISLSDFLRGDAGYTGVHVGCEHGVCGACTVLVDGQSARSCLMLAVQASNHEITTVEGLAGPEDTLHVLQQAFIDEHGLQCGFCTPGMLTTLVELLNTNPDPSDEDVRIGISGNLCRCTGYESIVAAALNAAKRLREERTA